MSEEVLESWIDGLHFRIRGPGAGAKMAGLTIEPVPPRPFDSFKFTVVEDDVRPDAVAGDKP